MIFYDYLTGTHQSRCYLSQLRGVGELPQARMILCSPGGSISSLWAPGPHGGYGENFHPLDTNEIPVGPFHLSILDEELRPGMNFYTVLDDGESNPLCRLSIN